MAKTMKVNLHITGDSAIGGVGPLSGVECKVSIGWPTLIEGCEVTGKTNNDGDFNKNKDISSTTATNAHTKGNMACGGLSGRTNMRMQAVIKWTHPEGSSDWEATNILPRQVQIDRRT